MMKILRGQISSLLDFPEQNIIIDDAIQLKGLKPRRS